MPFEVERVCCLRSLRHLADSGASKDDVAFATTRHECLASFKRRVQSAVLRARCAGQMDGNVLKQVLAAVCEAIETVLLGSAWAHAFASNGFSEGQAGLSAQVLGALCLEAAPDISCR